MSNELKVFRERHYLPSNNRHRPTKTRNTHIYIGLTATKFKDRFANHQTSFTSQRYRNATTLSIFIWDLKEKNINFNLKWKKIDQAASFTPITGRCNLCALEKYYLIFQPEICTLNKSDELNNFCLHKKPKLLEKTRIPRDLEDSARQ